MVERRTRAGYPRPPARACTTKFPPRGSPDVTTDQSYQVNRRAFRITQNYLRIRQASSARGVGVRNNSLTSRDWVTMSVGDFVTARVSIINTRSHADATRKNGMLRSIIHARSQDAVSFDEISLIMS